MASQLLPTLSTGLGRRSFDVRMLTTLLVGVGVYVYFRLGGNWALADADTVWHLETGRWILSHGAVPTSDPFSHTMRGTPWFASEWLAEVIFAAMYALGGWPGEVSITIAGFGLAFAIQARFLLDHLRIVTVVEFVVVGGLLMTLHLLARPHALAYPILTAWCAVLIRANDRGTPPPFWLVLLMPLWANLHGSFIFGLAFVGVMALEALVNAAEAARRQSITDWAAFFAASCLGACVTPYGPQLLFTLFRLTGMTEALPLIDEWQPTDFARFPMLEPALLTGLGLALGLGVKLPPMRTLMVLGLMHMALAHVRHVSVLTLVLPLLIASPLAAQFGRPAAAGLLSLSRLKAIGASLAIAAVVLAVSVRAVEPPQRNTPRQALAAIQAATDGPILNSYNFGGFLIFSKVAPAIDGRAEMYGQRFFLQHSNAVEKQDEAALRRYIDEHHIAATLFYPRTPAVEVLDRMPDWRRIYTDGLSVAHVRK